MSVLVQKIIPSEYAFVIHTKNPMNNNADELLGEVINGMGEGLVGAYEGQGFSFIYNKKSKNYQITSYQNKSIKLINGGDFIFRSDSNIEDIENFSGAGLFDSIPMEKDIEVDMSYKDDKLFTDESFTKKIMELAGKSTVVNPLTSEEYKQMNPASSDRPKNSQLSKDKLKSIGIVPANWEDALAEYLKEELK